MLGEEGIGGGKGTEDRGRAMWQAVASMERGVPIG